MNVFELLLYVPWRRKFLFKTYIGIIIGFGCYGCKNSSNLSEQFTLLDHNATGINFRNMLKETETFNIFKYQYFYNGGGVAIADFNNDGLQDICFTGNMVKNRLYLNKGNLSFEDLTEKSGIAKAEGWCTGVSAVDINADGWMDLYICRAGYPFENLRSNLLYINNGDLTFTDKAAEYGLADTAYSTQSAFFDYDRDGDLDMFLINHSTPEYSKGNLQIFALHDKKDPPMANKLFKNEEGHFKDVTELSGIKNNVLSFSLGLIVSDINNDGWQDIYVGNDFNESDYLLINNHDGTFTDSSSTFFDHTSMFSMGCDVADINNDQQMDLVSLDMLPESNYLQKLHSGADNYEKVKTMIDKGFQPQYSKNVLQVNNGDHTFSEKAQVMGISNTDWSWSPLFIDFDDDTYQDLFISNGYLRDHTDMDFLQFTMDLVIKIDRGEEKGNFEDYLKSMPPILQPNYFFSNDKGGKFINKDSSWNLTTPSVSQGAAYGDLDNDGDIDIVVNNSNNYAWIYRNNSHEIKQNNYVSFKLSGPEKNKNGLGSKVEVFSGSSAFTKELETCRGFQSSVEDKLFFGLDQFEKIDSVRIEWPDGKVQTQRDIKINQVNEIKYAPENIQINKPQSQKYFIPTEAIQYERSPSTFNDFKAQLLMPYFISDQGPFALTGDLNVDGNEDLLILGNSENPSVIFRQTEKGDFSKSIIFPAGKEISDALLLDLDGDKDLDLVFTVGSYKYQQGDPNLGVYFYSNDGNDNFKLVEFLATPEADPSSIASIEKTTSSNQKFIIGSTSYQGKFPLCSPLFIVNQNNNGRYVLQNTNLNSGLVNKIVVGDFNQDNTLDIVIASEWMPLKVFNETSSNELKDVTNTFFDTQESGLWKTIFPVDIDGDGKEELFAGNLGTNNQLTASSDHPLRMYYDDYDGNGSPDPIIAYYVIDDFYPFPPREDLIRQVPMMNKRFNSFGLYAKANIRTLLGNSFEKAHFLEVNTLENSIFKWQNGKWHRYALPSESQVAPIFSILMSDIDQDGIKDILTAGNMTKTKVKLGRLNGNHGLVLKYASDNLISVPYTLTGICVHEDIRQMVELKTGNSTTIGYLSSEGKSHFFTNSSPK